MRSQIIKYRNASGTEIILNRGNYTVAENDLRDFKWGFNAYNRPSGYGGRVSFSRGVQEKTLVVGVRGTTRDQFVQSADALLALTEPDIRNETPGRLYIDNQYIICYLAVESGVQYYARRAGWVSKELMVVVLEPFWNEEITSHFLTGAAEMVSGGKRYAGRYPYRYMSEISSRELTNEHYSPSPMIITIYGPCVDPRIIIDGHEYALSAQIVSNQRIIIDQLKKTIVAKNPDGAETNLFNNRNKEHDIFKFLAPGTSQVIYTGDFAFDITIIRQRSEPKWN